jgi:hypothetical protein
LKPREVQAAIFDVTGIALTVPTQEVWGRVAELIHAAADIRDVSLSKDEETCEWISDFLQTHNCIGRADPRRLDLTKHNDLAYVLINDEPFIDHDRRLWLRLARLTRHVTIMIGQRTTQHDLSERLGSLHFHRQRLEARLEDEDEDGKQTSPRKARFWYSRPGFNPDDDPALSPSPLSLSDFPATDAGTWSGGDNGAGPDIPHGSGGDKVGTKSRGDAQPTATNPLSDKGETQ